VQIAQVTTLVSGLLALTPKLATQLGLTNPSAISTAVTDTFAVIALIAGVVGVIKRQTSKIQPLTMSTDAAAAHPATQVAVAAGTASPATQTAVATAAAEGVKK
jgi:uncharacterized membrane protein